MQEALLVLLRVQHRGAALQHALAVRLEELEQVVVAHVVDDAHADLVLDLVDRHQDAVVHHRLLAVVRQELRVPLHRQLQRLLGLLDHNQRGKQ